MSGQATAPELQRYTDRVLLCVGKQNRCDNRARYTVDTTRFPTLCGLCDIAENEGNGTRVPWGGLRQ